MSNNAIQTIDVTTLKQRWEQDPSLLVIDVREPFEHEEVCIPGTVLIPKDEIQHEIASVAPDKNTPIYLHCKAGVRSLYAAEVLVDMGYQTIYSIDGGILAWLSQGYETR